MKDTSLTYSQGKGNSWQFSLNYNSAPMQIKHQPRSSQLYHARAWQPPSLVSKIHFSQANDMCQALISSATFACQHTKGFHNAFGFSEISSIHKAAADTKSILKMDTWPKAQTEWSWRFLNFIKIIPTVSLPIKIKSSQEQPQVLQWSI